MKIPIRDEPGEEQRVEINKSIDDICLHHLLGDSTRKPYPVDLILDVNSCYGCTPDEYNKKCPRYIRASTLHVFEILENN